MDTKDIIAAIKYARTQKGISQEAIAFDLGISSRSYSKMECGITRLSLRRFFKICVILEITPEELFVAAGSPWFVKSRNDLKEINQHKSLFDSLGLYRKLVDQKDETIRLLRKELGES